VALSVVKEAYNRDFDKAKTPKENVSLAKKLVEEADATKDDGGGGYVLRRVKYGMAAQQGDFLIAFNAIEKCGPISWQSRWALS
jgi:hypothetical protein